MPVQQPTSSEVINYAREAQCSTYEASMALRRKYLLKAISELPFASVELKEILNALAKRA